MSSMLIKFTFRQRQPKSKSTHPGLTSARERILFSDQRDIFIYYIYIATYKRKKNVNIMTIITILYYIQICLWRKNNFSALVKSDNYGFSKEFTQNRHNQHILLFKISVCTLNQSMTFCFLWVQIWYETELHPFQTLLRMGKTREHVWQDINAVSKGNALSM